MTALEPGLAAVSQALQQGQLRSASLQAIELVKRYPMEARPQALLAEVHLHADRPDLALICLQRTVALEPTTAAYRIRLGQCQARLGQRREALQSAEQAASMSLTSARLCDGLGTLYAHCDEPATALPWFQRAVDLEPGAPELLYNLAAAQRMVGDLVGAEISLDKVIEARPDHGSAYLTRSDLRQQTSERNHVKALRERLDRSELPREQRVPLLYALGKELEDLGQYSAAFAAWSEGGALQKAHSGYRVQEDIDTLHALTREHSSESLRQGSPGLASREPIFVFGLPRSGTTLVESILGAHPDVTTPGELPTFPTVCVSALAARGERALSKMAFVQRSLTLPAEELGQAYLGATRPQTGLRPHFIDKLPLNYLYAGLIHRALPDARCILLVRDPLDTCLAMYKTLFTAAYPFSYALEDLGAYYLAWRDLMEHWQKVLGPSLLTVRYEDLVTDTQRLTRRMLAHCRLSPHPDCLQYQGRSSPVSTASAAQVRQPVYSTSRGRWRHYAQELTPLMTALCDVPALEA